MLCKTSFFPSIVNIRDRDLCHLIEMLELWVLDGAIKMQNNEMRLIKIRDFTVYIGLSLFSGTTSMYGSRQAPLSNLFDRARLTPCSTFASDCDSSPSRGGSLFSLSSLEELERRGKTYHILHVYCILG